MHCSHSDSFLEVLPRGKKLFELFLLLRTLFNCCSSSKVSITEMARKRLHVRHSTTEADFLVLTRFILFYCQIITK